MVQYVGPLLRNKENLTFLIKQAGLSIPVKKTKVLYQIKQKLKVHKSKLEINEKFHWMRLIFQKDSAQILPFWTIQANKIQESLQT